MQRCYIENNFNILYDILDLYRNITDIFQHQKLKPVKSCTCLYNLCFNHCKCCHLFIDMSNGKWYIYLILSIKYIQYIICRMGTATNRNYNTHILLYNIQFILHYIRYLFHIKVYTFSILLYMSEIKVYLHLVYIYIL